MACKAERPPISGCAIRGKPTTGLSRLQIIRDRCLYQTVAFQARRQPAGFCARERCGLFQAFLKRKDRAAAIAFFLHADLL